MKSQSGFTLIELMAALTLLALLLSASLPLADLARRRAQESELRHSLRQIRDAIDAYRQAVTDKKITVSPEQSGYPPSLASLVEGWWIAAIPMAASFTSCAGYRRTRCVSAARGKTRPRVGTRAVTTARWRRFPPVATSMTSVPRAAERASMAFPINNGRPARGFTLIELLVVMSIIGALMALVSPSYFKNNDRARETVLRHNLAVLRQAMDDYRADHGANPSALQDLVSNRYLRELPLDPILGQRDGWQTRPAEDGGIGEVSSGAKGAGLDGSDYGSW